MLKLEYRDVLTAIIHPGVLEHYGATIPVGTTLTNDLSISADGSTIVGSYVDSRLRVGNWRAHIAK